MKHFSRFSLIFLAIATLLAAWTTVALAICTTGPAGGSNQSVVMVLGYNPTTNTHIQASGFFLNRQGDVVTNYHALVGASQLHIRTALGKCYTVTEIRKKDVFGDLAILGVSIPAEQIFPVTIASPKPNKGQQIYVIGHPLGHPQDKSEGVIAALFPFTKSDNLIQFTAPIKTGSSGSPIFNIEGNVVGVAAFILFTGPESEPHNYGIPVSRLQYLQ